MNKFLETTFLTQIIEESTIQPVIIFKFSSECKSSERLYKKIKEKMENGTINSPIYLVTVQKMPVLSKKIAENFNIKHESPQVIIFEKEKIIYTAHHNNIDISKFK